MQTATKGEPALEIELKFEVTSAQLRRLTRSERFKALQKDRPRSTTLRATYFDTPDFKLARRKLALRVRQQGRQFVQCLKAQSDDGGGVGFARHEWEWTVLGEVLNTEVLRAEPPIKALFKGISQNALAPIYATDIKRQSRDLHTPGGALVRCDIDQGRVYLGALESTVCEMELELVSGPVEELFRIAAMIADIVPVRLSNRTKSGRGEVLAQGRSRWVCAQHPALPKKASAADVLRISLSEGLQHLLSNEDCVLHRCHTEGVHQMRIAFRRMRSVIATYIRLLPKGCYEVLSQGLKNAGNGLGPARDWDVFLNEIIGPVAVGFEHDADLLHMTVRATARQDEAYAQAEVMIRSPEYAQVLSQAVVWLGMAAWQGEGGSKKLTKPAARIAKDILERRHTRLLKVGRGLKYMSIDQRHRLRIAIKKARYAAAFFAELYPAKTTKPYLQALKNLQENLGHLNDLATAERLMSELITAERGVGVHKLIRAAGRVEGWFMHAQSLREDDLKTTWTHFKKAKTFW